MSVYNKIIDDLAGLGYAELDSIVLVARNRRDELAAKQKKEIEEKQKNEEAKAGLSKKQQVLKLLKSAAFEKWRVATKEFFEQVRQLDNKNVEVELLIPVKITGTLVNNCLDADEIFDRYSNYPEFNYEVEDIKVAVGKGELTKKQQEILQVGVNQVKDSWCSAVLDVFNLEKNNKKLQIQGQKLLDKYVEFCEICGGLVDGVYDLVDPEDFISGLEQDIAYAKQISD